MPPAAGLRRVHRQRVRQAAEGPAQRVQRAGAGGAPRSLQRGVDGGIVREARRRLAGVLAGVPPGRGLRVLFHSVRSPAGVRKGATSSLHVWACRLGHSHQALLSCQAPSVKVSAKLRIAFTAYCYDRRCREYGTAQQEAKERAGGVSEKRATGRERTGARTGGLRRSLSSSSASSSLSACDCRGCSRQRRPPRGDISSCARGCSAAMGNCCWEGRGSPGLSAGCLCCERVAACRTSCEPRANVSGSKPAPLIF